MLKHMLEESLSDCLARAVSADRLAGGVVLVEKHGEAVVEAAAGWADREAHRKMTAETIFHYSSFTKPIVAAATMALVEQGVVQLDDAVTQWLPEFRPKLPNGDEPRIDVRHLLTHAAGLTYGLLQPAGGTYEKAGVSDGLDQPGLSMREELERIASVPLINPPGTEWGYSVAYDVLGELIARAAGSSLPEVVAKASEALNRINALISDQNLTAISATLGHTERAAATLPATVADARAMFRDLREAADEMQTAMSSLAELGGTGGENIIAADAPTGIGRI